MANDQEMLELLEEADRQTNEIANDIEKLLQEQGTSPEVKARLLAHVAKLKTVAGTYPTKPPEETGK